MNNKEIRKASKEERKYVQTKAHHLVSEVMLNLLNRIGEDRFNLAISLETLKQSLIVAIGTYSRAFKIDSDLVLNLIIDDLEAAKEDIKIIATKRI